MSTPLTDSINALTTYANEVTGQSDTTLSDAVHTLASGYGGGDSSTAIINDVDTKFFKYNNGSRWFNGKASSIFSLLRGLEVLYLDSITDIDVSMFIQDSWLKAAIFPEVTHVCGGAFYTFHTEPIFDFHQVITADGNYPFKINKVIFVLRGDQKSSIYIKKGSWGYPSQAKFYVPQSLLSEYIADSDIVAYGEENILPIEGSPYEDVNWWKTLI